MIKGIIALILELVGAVAYKLCVPTMFLLIACKLWYAPYTWSWLNTIIFPLSCGACGFILVLIAQNVLED